MDEFVSPADPNDARDDYDDVVDNCVATDSTPWAATRRMPTGSSAPKALAPRAAVRSSRAHEDGPFLCTTGHSQT